MKTSTAIFSALAAAGLSLGLASAASAQVPVYQTTVTYTTYQPVKKIKHARVVSVAPAVAVAPVVPAAPVMVVQRPVYVAPPPARVYVPPPPVWVAPPVYYAPPAVNVGFAFGGCGPRVGFGIGVGGIGFGFGGYFGPGACW